MIIIIITIVTNCQNHISTVNVLNPDREKDNDGWCEADERPSEVTDTLLQKPEVTDSMLPICSVYTVKPLNINDKYVNV